MFVKELDGKKMYNSAEVNIIEHQQYGTKHIIYKTTLYNMVTYSLINVVSWMHVDDPTSFPPPLLHI